MDTIDTPGKRLRYFSNTFFTSVTAFARELGYQKPGSLYDYFNDRKKPGGLLLDRFRTIGGDPNWLRYGAGSMFANSDAGTALRIRYQNSLHYLPADHALHSAEPTSSYQAEETSPVPMEHGEALYVLISRSLFRLKTSRSVTPDILRLYRGMLADIEKELNKQESNRQEHR